MPRGWRYVFNRPKPTPYQVEALKRAVKLRRFGVFFQQRVGKTRVAIDYAGVQYLRGNVRRVLIACPKSVREVWVEQIKQYLPREIPCMIEVFDPRRSDLAATRDRHDDKDLLLIRVANYDMVWRYEDHFLKWKPDLVVADEAHLLKSPSSRRSKAMWRIGRRATDRLALTGTPYAKAPTDIFGVARFIDEDIFGMTWTKFKERYVTINPYTRAVTGYMHLDELSDKMRPFSMRILRKDAGIREPEAETVTIRVELETKAKKLYNELAQEGIASLESGDKVVAAHVLTQMMRLQQITGGFATLEDGNIEQVSKTKVEAVKDLVETHADGDEQVIIVCRFKPEIRALHAALSSVAVGAVIDGDTPPEIRAATINRFRTGKPSKYDYLILQEAVGSMGIDLSTARVMILYSVDFSLSNFQQVKDRIMGRGQKADSVTYYHMVVKGSIDEYVIETLGNNEEITSMVADKYKEVFRKI